MTAPRWPLSVWQQRSESRAKAQSLISESPPPLTSHRSLPLFFSPSLPAGAFAIASVSTASDVTALKCRSALSMSVAATVRSVTLARAVSLASPSPSPSAAPPLSSRCRRSMQMRLVSREVKSVPSGSTVMQSTCHMQTTRHVLCALM